MEKMNMENTNRFKPMDKELETTVNALTNPRCNYEYLFENYLHVLKKRKNVMMEKVDTILKAYNDERKVSLDL